MRWQRPILLNPEDERQVLALAGRLTAPLRERSAVLVAAAQLEQWLRARGVAGDPRMPAALIARVRAGQAPLVHQLLTLEEITGAGIYTCLRLLGYDLEDVPVLQAVLHRDRTITLPAAVYDRDRAIVWPAAFNEHAELSRGEFVPEVVSRFGSHAAAAFEDEAASRFVYLRIGRFAGDLSPNVVPGSIVRIDTADCGPARFNPRVQRRLQRPVYAVAHVRGLTCTYVDWIDDRRIALIPSPNLRPPAIHHLDDEAVVLGRVCAELRPLDSTASAVTPHSHDHCANRLIRPDPNRQTFGAFLRSSREAIGMTHRDAHAISVRVAEAYGDRRFAIGVGTLSDWESQRELPLSVPHVISLAVCYAVSFTDLLRAARLLPSERRPSASGAQLPDAVDRSLFQPALWPAARLVAGLPDLSWDDVFRCGDGATVFDPALAGARYLIVNRRVRALGRAVWPRSVHRPLYIVSDECGRHICAHCFADRDQLYIQPDPHLSLPIRAVSRDRIKIRGRVAAVLRCR